jgi:23S rRNA pseudouridine2605 synthase
MESESIRLNKFLAEKTGISRRAADELITRGRVVVNGKTAELGSRVHVSDNLVVDDKPITGERRSDFTYLLLNKPVGYVSSRHKQGDNETIYALLPEKYHQLKPVGRLDKDSSGLLLLTNDGDFAHQMTHPKFYKVKKYEVELSTPLAPLHRQMVNDHGVQLEDGGSKLSLERLHEGNDKAWQVIMHEGRNRQIRRTFAALGYKVISLHRISFGNYLLSIAKGQFQEVKKQ